MPKPDKRKQPRAYAAWVRRQLRDWDPADDKPDFHPRSNGILAPDDLPDSYDPTDQ